MPHVSMDQVRPPKTLPIIVLEPAGDGNGDSKTPKHLWRQPRVPVRIQHRGYSDTERDKRAQQARRGFVSERSHAVEAQDRPELQKSRMSWPTSLQGTSRRYGQDGLGCGQ